MQNRWFNMSDLNEAEAPIVSPLDMSPEEMANFTLPDEALTDESMVPPEEADDSEADETFEGEPEEFSEDDDNEDLEEDGESDEPALDTDTTFEGDDSDGVDEVAEVDVTVHTKFFNEITAPFQANGKQVTINNAADVITLMKKGAGYDKAMAGLRPTRLLNKMLKDNGLDDVSKLNHLIDLSKGNQAAITQLMNDNSVDPLSIDVNQADYTPNSYSADDTSLQLDDAITTVKGTASGARAIDIVSNSMDAVSKATVLNNPQLLVQINDQIANGAYDNIMAKVEHERLVGRLVGMSDLDAYKFIGDSIYAKPQVAPAEANDIVKRKPVATNPKLKQRRKAASPTRQAPQRQKAKFSGKSPLDMSPAELAEASKFFT